MRTLLSEAVGEYLNEDCHCTVSNLDTPNIDTEDHIAIEDKRSMRFEVDLSYKEE
ncbi:MAG: hypothetical protein U5J63_08945 [Fodinibius sp.]|nr:hypothetical protein [Fodinibius sp.]